MTCGDFDERLFGNPITFPDELFHTPVAAAFCRIEGFIGDGQASPPGLCYHQDQNKGAIGYARGVRGPLRSVEQEKRDHQCISNVQARYP
jgi:hypothetical protein